MKVKTVRPRKQKLLGITVDEQLDNLFGDKILFPAKLAQANNFLVKHPIPDSREKANS